MQHDIGTRAVAWTSCRIQRAIPDTGPFSLPAGFKGKTKGTRNRVIKLKLSAVPRPESVNQIDYQPSTPSPRPCQVKYSQSEFNFSRSDPLSPLTRHRRRREPPPRVPPSRSELFSEPLERRDERPVSSRAGMHSQIVCHGCRRVLCYPSGAPSVCCGACQAITIVPPPALEMAQLICGGCRTLLMYTRNADTVRCSCCRTVNLVRSVNNIAHVNCGQCRTTLMYPYGAPSVKCALCNFVTNTGINTMAPTPCPVPTPNGSSYNVPSTSVSTTQPQNVTVVVENPMTVDGKGKLVSNVVVGITPGKQ
ncbi:hypothetical protein BRADI_1g13971v3 [Brachypodium distachyon]|uniref:Zinc finger LSD1-type domain-containing protein n=2 Tax=Brachypodium distachyon TaxID=15368 RepID=A0A0Q3NB55_BRADI|nr:hypothetical protein BRADI_1g13971v3 [Brachypodium distachyon]